MRLTVSLDKGIEVVVPDSMSRRQMNKFIPQFVKDRQLWISEAIEKLQAKNALRKTIEQCQLPEEIILPAIDQIFAVNYLPDSAVHQSQTMLQLLHKGEFQLEFRGNVNNKKQVFALLEGFFKDYARYYLTQKLEQLSCQLNLPYNRLTIRAQKTRWGSCSAKKNINLNYRLLFIDEELLDYIVLHELIHTVHMNHSKAFWTCLESFMPDARRRDKKINQVVNELPCWIHFS